MQSIYLAGGCFWCTEAIFKNLKGVIRVLLVILEVKSLNPTYNIVCEW